MTIEQVITDVLRREGGYVQHLADKGGPTKFGVTAHTLADWRGRPVTAEDVRALTETEARQIYHRRYVTDYQLDQIPDEHIRAMVVDDGVLSGPRQAIQSLQRALWIPFDGVLGPQTLAACEKADPAALTVALVTARCLRLARLCQRDPSQIVFLAGWLDRALSFLR